MWWARGVAIALLVPLASLDLAAAFGPVYPGLGLRAAPLRAAVTRTPLRATNDAGGEKDQKNTGRFHQLADFDHTDMNHKEFR